MDFDEGWITHVRGGTLERQWIFRPEIFRAPSFALGAPTFLPTQFVKLTPFFPTAKFIVTLR